jgi:hypothetical protein
MGDATTMPELTINSATGLMNFSGYLLPRLYLICAVNTWCADYAMCLV